MAPTDAVGGDTPHTACQRLSPSEPPPAGGRRAARNRRCGKRTRGGVAFALGLLFLSAVVAPPTLLLLRAMVPCFPNLFVHRVNLKCVLDNHPDLPPQMVTEAVQTGLIHILQQKKPGLRSAPRRTDTVLSVKERLSGCNPAASRRPEAANRCSACQNSSWRYR